MIRSGQKWPVAASQPPPPFPLRNLPSSTGTTAASRQPAIIIFGYYHYLPPPSLGLPLNNPSSASLSVFFFFFFWKAPRAACWPRFQAEGEAHQSIIGQANFSYIWIVVFELFNLISLSRVARDSKGGKKWSRREIEGERGRIGNGKSELQSGTEKWRHTSAPVVFGRSFERSMLFLWLDWFLFSFEIWILHSIAAWSICVRDERVERRNWRWCYSKVRILGWKSSLLRVVFSYLISKQNTYKLSFKKCQWSLKNSLKYNPAKLVKTRKFKMIFFI